MRILSLLSLCIICISFEVPSEDWTGTYARIVAQGEGEISVTPTHVEFQFIIIRKDPQLENTIKAIQEIENKLRLKFTEESPRPVQIETVGPLYQWQTEPQTELRISVTFSLAGFVSTADGPRLFAQLWDKIKNLAKGLDIELKGPYFHLQHEETAIRTAINTAIEKAYPYAEACASALKGTLYAVDKIEVNKIDWSYTGKKENEPISLIDIRCKATVTVTYLVSQM